jgi:LytS/YehU family sensor histidine kinase
MNKKDFFKKMENAKGWTKIAEAGAEMLKLYLKPPKIEISKKDLKLLKKKIDPYFLFKYLNSYTSEIKVYDDDTLLFYSKFKNYHNVMYRSRKTKRYSTLWSERKIYNDLNCLE